MNIEILILAISIHALIWEHLPHWGIWFMRIIGALPQPLQTLYGQWHCPYCAGFWIALALHAVTGTWTFTGFAGFAQSWGGAAAPLAWFFDALATAILIKTGALLLNALSGPAIKGYQMKAEFIAARDEA